MYYKTSKERPTHIGILNFMAYHCFIISLYCITKPLAWLVDITSTEEDTQFLKE